MILNEKKTKKSVNRSRQDLNLRGETPTDFKSVALTTRPRLPNRRLPNRQQTANNLSFKQQIFASLVFRPELNDFKRKEDEELSIVVGRIWTCAGRPQQISSLSP